jgi:hypothetical protein
MADRLDALPAEVNMLILEPLSAHSLACVAIASQTQAQLAARIAVRPETWAAGASMAESFVAAGDCQYRHGDLDKVKKGMAAAVELCAADKMLSKCAVVNHILPLATCTVMAPAGSSS